MLKFKFLFLFLIAAVNLYPDEYEKIWGIKQQNFVSSLPTSDYTIFRPEEKPEYKNRIISFFNTMGGEGVRVLVLRIKGTPEKDYCFFNSMLYSVSEDWGSTSSKNAESIIKKIETRYSVKNIDNKDDTTIITFEKDKNKIIVYKKPADNNYIKLRLFYYSNDIFNILLKD